MKTCITILFLLGLLQPVLSQRNYLLKLDQLNSRIENGGDTTFVINFWATWCGPCVRELPNFEKLGKQHKSEKLKVLLVSLDFKSKLKSSVIPFIKRKKLGGEIFLLDEKDQQQYIDRIDTSWSGSLPATLFVKKQQRKFIEEELSYSELVTQYKSMQ